METLRDQDAIRRRVQPQPFMARDYFAPMPTPISASPTNPSQSGLGLYVDVSTPIPALE